MKTVRIRTKGKTEESVIVCRKNALKAASPFASFVFTDSNVYAIYRKEIEKNFPGTPVHVMPAGEENKTYETLFALLSAMARAGLHRNDTLVCVGGGVTGDVGGLAAALYMRGIDCIQIPTTLLSQVDSSVGGKTAVDFEGVKNLVGVFHQPVKVFADGSFLKTLPPREIRCGLGEIVKHGALCPPLFDRLWENRNGLFGLDFLEGIVSENIAFKADVVKKDPEETGLRKCLNLGHTTAHAFELCGGGLSHGEYVLAGLLFEAELAKMRVECDAEFLDRLKELSLLCLGGMPALPPAEEAARRARLDKKNRARDTVTVTAPVKKGEYALLEIPCDEYARDLKNIAEALC